MASSTKREAPASPNADWVSEIQTPRASKAEWQDFEWDTDDATKTNIVVKPLKLLDEPLSAQDALRRYTVCREVPYGGLPDVHLALLEGAAGFRRTVAVQRLRHEPGADPRATPGLSPDALLGCHVRHPNVIPVLDLIQVQGEFLLVMEYVISETLAQLRGQGNRPPIPISVAIASGILHALDAAHTARDSFDTPLDIVHAGLSPDTALVGVDGITRLIHFGLSKKGPPVGSGRTPKGRPGYFAPEQVFDRRVDARTDVFAAGILLWESLSGRPLLEGDSPVDCMMRFLSRGARPPSEINPQVSDRLDAVLARALEPAPERRFQTAAEFVEALEAAVEPATRAEVSRYVEGLAWVSIREQRALLNDTRPEDDAPRAARASDPEPVPAMHEEDDPTIVPGSLPYLNAGADLVSHWAARRPDEATAVEKRPVPTAPPSGPAAGSGPVASSRPATASGPAAASGVSALAPKPERESAPTLEFAPALSEPRELPSSPTASPSPMPAAARVSSRAPESFGQRPVRAGRSWVWPSVAAVAGLALLLTLQFRPGARQAVRQLFTQEEPRAAHTTAVVQPPATLPSVASPAQTVAAPVVASPDVKADERVLRLDDLPLLRESQPQAPPSTKPPARKSLKKIRRRAAAAPLPSAAPSDLAPATAPSLEEPINLDP